MTSNGEPYHRLRYRAIIQEQVMLGYLTKGGITYGDTELMTPHERKIAMDTIKEILEEQNKQRESAIKNNSKRDPITRISR